MAPDRDAALTSRHMLRVAIFGAGALGGYFGSRLARAEAADVHLIARGAQLDAIRARGLTVRSVDGDFHVELSATDEPAEIGPVDVVFFAVKSYDTESAAARLTPLLGADTGVVSFQNGIDNEEKLAAVIGAAHVMGGAAFVCAPAARDMFRRILEEVVQVARAEGVPLADTVVARHLAFAQGLEAGGYSSLYHDLVTGHRMELEALHGELLGRAERHEIATPTCRDVYAILQPWARRAQGPLSASND